jgi:hypothetical protein
MITDTERDRVVAEAEWLRSHGNQIGYDQNRPFHLYGRTEIQGRFDVGEGISGDCFWYVCQCFYLAGLKDPGGNSFNGLGNTETVLQTLRSQYTDPAAALPGALVVFGADLPLGDQHVCLVVEAGEDPILDSHGAPNVKRLTLSEEQSAHRGSTVFCSPAQLG